MMECPCKDCKDRYIKTDNTGVHRCHSSCQRYIDYSNQCNLIKTQLRKAKEENFHLWQVSRHNMNKRYVRKSAWIQA